MSKTEKVFAFPVTDNVNGGEEGMELRDWFAGMAMQGMLSADTDNVAPSLELVKAAYEYADQMLEERKK